MGWSVGYDTHWQRDIGYAVPAFCDQPKCPKHIDRGLAHVCGGEPFGGEKGCGLYFCPSHLFFGRKSVVCKRCLSWKKPYKPKPEMRPWLRWKLKHESWAEWRSKNPDIVKEYEAILSKKEANHGRRSGRHS